MYDPDVKFETKKEVISKSVPIKNLLPYFDAKDGLNIIEDLAENRPTCYGFKDYTLEKYIKENFERTTLRLSLADFI